MDCVICNNSDAEMITEIDDMLDDLKAPKYILAQIKQTSATPFTLRDLSFHKRHRQNEKPTQSFVFENDELRDARTGEIIPWINAKDALRIILTLGTRQILASGGVKIGARYTVEAGKVLAELGQDDTLTKNLLETWRDELKKAHPIAHVRTYSNQEAADYRELQDRKKLEFLERVNAPEVAQLEPPGE